MCMPSKTSPTLHKESILQAVVWARCCLSLLAEDYIYLASIAASVCHMAVCAGLTIGHRMDPWPALMSYRYSCRAKVISVPNNSNLESVELLIVTTLVMLSGASGLPIPGLDIAR